MKVVNIVISGVLIVMCIIGWGSFVIQTVSNSNRYEQYIEQGDEWVKDGLYQRAIEQYQLALEEESSEKLYEKILDTYLLRYQEASEETYEEYSIFLEGAVNEYPANEKLVGSYVSICKSEGEYEDIYNCLLNAIANGLDNSKIRSMLRDAQYAFDIQRGDFYTINHSVNGYYAVERVNGWNMYSEENGYLLYSDVMYVGLANGEGTTVAVADDARLIHGDGTVLGIFKDAITSAGMFADGLVPACCEGKYNYYDEFAVKQFGGYEMAGTFQGGKAAVKKDGKWMLIDTKGEVVSDKYLEIVLNEAGQYLINDTILVQEKEGEYSLYNADWDKRGTIKCDDVDVLTEDGWIAICIDGKWGFADKEGTIKIKPEYEQAKSFSNGVAGVCENDLWGFIDAEKNVVITHQFLEVGYMDEFGKCPVRVDEGLEQPNEIWQFIQLILGIKEN